MDLGSIFLILSLFILVALFVGRPLFEEKRISVATQVSEQHVRSSLMAERDHILDALQELDFDYTLGKIPEEDYPLQRKSLLVAGSEILRQLDEETTEEQSQAVEDRLEAAIAARRADSGNTAASVMSSAESVNTRQAGSSGRFVGAAIAEPDDDLEVILANRKRARPDKSAGFCSQCGSPVQKSDRFCPKCGSKTAV